MGNIHQPSEAQLEILQVLWEQEPATVKEIHEVLKKKKDVRYTTTLKQIQRMTEKGMLERIETGKVHQYKAIAKEEKVQESLFQKLVNSAFKGSALKLVMHALGNNQATGKEIETLEKFLEQQKTQSNDKSTH